MWIKHNVEQTKESMCCYDSVYVVQEQATITNADRNQNSYLGFKEMTGKGMRECSRVLEIISSSEECLPRCRHMEKPSACTLKICALYCM